jgi:hypothetical protein
MALVDTRALPEHVQVTRCDIKPGSVEKTRDVEMGWFQKKFQGYLYGTLFKTPLPCLVFYLRLQTRFWKIIFMKHTLNIYKKYDSNFFGIILNKKCARYNCFYKTPKKWLLLK